MDLVPRFNSIDVSQDIQNSRMIDASMVNELVQPSEHDEISWKRDLDSSPLRETKLKDLTRKMKSKKRKVGLKTTALDVSEISVEVNKD